MMRRHTMMAMVLAAALGTPVSGQVRPNPGPPVPQPNVLSGTSRVLIRDQSADGGNVVGTGSVPAGFFNSGPYDPQTWLDLIPCDYADCFWSSAPGAGAQAVSDDGTTVVGTVFRGQRGPIEFVATPIISTPLGGLQNLQAVFGDMATTAEGVTGDGQFVVGRSDAMPSGGYIWSAASGAADLASVVGVDGFSEFWLARNCAVLFVLASDSGARTVHRWHPNEQARTLGNLPVGEVILRWSRLGEACFSEATVWTPAETNSLPTGVDWLDVSDDGTVVIGQEPFTAGSQRNWVWRRGAPLTSFQDLVHTLLYRAAAYPNPAWAPAFDAYRLQSLRSSEHLVAGAVTIDGEAAWWMEGLDFSTYCRADVNLDGFLNPDDLSDFITGFFSSPPDAIAFWRGESPPNPDDLSDYITAFFSGCP